MFALFVFRGPSPGVRGGRSNSWRWGPRRPGQDLHSRKVGLRVSLSRTLQLQAMSLIGPIRLVKSSQQPKDTLCTSNVTYYEVLFLTHIMFYLFSILYLPLSRLLLLMPSVNLWKWPVFLQLESRRSLTLTSNTRRLSRAQSSSSALLPSTQTVPLLYLFHPQWYSIIWLLCSAGTVATLLWLASSSAHSLFLPFSISMKFKFQTVHLRLFRLI